MIEIILGAILIIITAVLAEKAPPKWRKLVWGSFVVLVIAQAVIQIKGYEKANTEKQAAELQVQKLQAKVQEANDKLDASRTEQARMAGHLEGIQTIMDNFSKSGVPGMKEFAQAVSAMVKQSPNRPAIQEMSPKQLRGKVIEFAQDMRKYAGEFIKNNAAFFQTREQIIKKDPSMSEEQKKVALTEGTNSFYQGHLTAFEIEFRQAYAGSATEYKDELIRRLGPQKPLTPAQQFDLVWPTNTYRGLITPAIVINSADYLDALARQLPAR